MVCTKCGRDLNDTAFYSYKDGTKNELCKKCLTMHVDNFDPETYVWILEKLDLPYIPSEWNSLREKAYAKGPEKMNGTTVLGKYISKMKLKQWKDYSWKDTEKLQKEDAKKQAAIEEERRVIEERTKAQFEAGAISEAEYKTLMSANAQRKSNLSTSSRAAPAIGSIQEDPFNEDYFISEDDLPNPASELTDEDKIYLAMKWGRTYRPEDWVALEKNYNEMMDSFDIDDADTKNTLILLCKINLKMNQSIDSGDIEGALKASKMYDSFRKTAKFTAAQNKNKKEEFVDSIGELITLCEREGFIPRYATDVPQDKVDATLRDMKAYNKKLVTEDLGFGQQIEDALKKLQIQKEMREADDEAFDEEFPNELSDDNYEQFYKEIEEQKKADMEIYEDDSEGVT